MAKQQNDLKDFVGQDLPNLPNGQRYEDYSGTISYTYICNWFNWASHIQESIELKRRFYYSPAEKKALVMPNLKSRKERLKEEFLIFHP